MKRTSQRTPAVYVNVKLCYRLSIGHYNLWKHGHYQTATAAARGAILSYDSIMVATFYLDADAERERTVRLDFIGSYRNHLSLATGGAVVKLKPFVVIKHTFTHGNMVLTEVENTNTKYG